MRDSIRALGRAPLCAFAAGALLALQPHAVPAAHPDSATASPARLFAAVEEAWISGAAEALGALVDTTRVRIALTPGERPTTAVTKSAAAFLFQDQLRLVATQSFQVTRFSVGKRSASARARWVGDWGAGRGMRRLRIALTAAPVEGRWLLVEIRTLD